MVLAAAFGLQAREIHFWELRMPRAPCTLKITKARVRLESMHPENRARIAHTVFPLYARNRAADRQKKNPGCQFIPSDEIFGIRRNSNAKAYDFFPLYPYDIGSLTHFDMLAMCGTAASQQPDGDIYDGCS